MAAKKKSTGKKGGKKGGKQTAMSRSGERTPRYGKKGKA